MRCGNNFKSMIFKPIIQINILGSHCEIALRWMRQDLTNDKSTLVQVMAWCCQAPSHYLSQCWPRSISPYGVTKPQRVNVSLTAQHYFSSMNFHKVSQGLTKIALISKSLLCQISLCWKSKCFHRCFIVTVFLIQLSSQIRSHILEMIQCKDAEL